MGVERAPLGVDSRLKLRKEVKVKGMLQRFNNDGAVMFNEAMLRVLHDHLSAEVGTVFFDSTLGTVKDLHVREYIRFVFYYCQMFCNFVMVFFSSFCCFL